MIHQCFRDRVGQGANGLTASRIVRKDGEVRREEIVRLRDRDLKAQPVASGRDGVGREVVVREPLVDSSDGLIRRRDERGSLRGTRWSEKRTTMYSNGNAPPPW